MTLALSVDTVAVRLADEGVPLCAIARATNIPSADLRQTLHAAHDDGRLLELPKEDWPPGFPRDQRALQLSRLVVEDRDALVLALQQLFGLTGTEVGLFMGLLQNKSVPKARLDMAHRTIDVHVCRIRHRLAPFQVSVDTLWGYGYQLSADSRRKVMDLIVAHVARSAV